MPRTGEKCEFNRVDTRGMSAAEEMNDIHEIESDVVAYMRLWGVNEEAARAMVELEKNGICWASPIAGEHKE